MSDILFIGVALYLGYQWGKAEGLKQAAANGNGGGINNVPVLDNHAFNFSGINCQNIMN